MFQSIIITDYYTNNLKFSSFCIQHLQYNYFVTVFNLYLKKQQLVINLWWNSILFYSTSFYYISFLNVSFLCTAFLHSIVILFLCFPFFAKFFAVNCEKKEEDIVVLFQLVFPTSSCSLQVFLPHPSHSCPPLPSSLFSQQLVTLPLTALSFGTD